MVGDRKNKLPRKSTSVSKTRPATNSGRGINRLFRQLSRSLIEKLLALRNWAWRHKFFFDALWSLIVAGPPFFVVYYLQSEKFGAQFKAVMPALAGPIDSDPMRWAVAAPIWIFLCVSLKNKVGGMLQARPTGWENVAPILVKALDNIVGKKEQRFSQSLRKALQRVANPTDIICASDVFGEITQPEVQVNEIVTNLYTAFSLLTAKETANGDVLKVNLALS